MTRTWTDWPKHHAMLFALLSKEEENMLREWGAILDLAGWTAEEAWAASEWMARHDPPSARAKHLKALQDRMTTARLEKRAREEAAPDRGECVICEGQGVLIVPRRRQNKKTGAWEMPNVFGRDEFYTTIVACFCALGRWTQEHRFVAIHRGPRGDTEHRLMGLDEYEAINPDWRAQLEQRERVRGRERGVNDYAANLDKALGAIRRRQRETGHASKD